MKQNRTFSGTGKLIEKKESLCIAEIEVIFVESLPTTVFFGLLLYVTISKACGCFLISLAYSSQFKQPLNVFATDPNLGLICHSIPGFIICSINE